MDNNKFGIESAAFARLPREHAARLVKQLAVALADVEGEIGISVRMTDSYDFGKRAEVGIVEFTVLGADFAAIANVEECEVRG